MSINNNSDNNISILLWDLACTVAAKSTNFVKTKVNLSIFLKWTSGCGFKLCEKERVQN